ncbi:hypothetical protein HELRODRAFT_137401, partial [Helobdella robusta]|uniref:Potassium channel inwardly rectifying transmembrane domain-containing protein n=1 Tax=Helobdella robusta TaxID=6412 RepID=T1EIK3_HELRO
IFLFVGSWFGFAVIWYLVAYFHGDLDKKYFENDEQDFKPCIKGLEDFVSALFFSIDLQSTMGYGNVEIQDECPMAVALFVIQAFIGIVVQSLAGSIIFARYNNSRKKSKKPTWS